MSSIINQGYSHKGSDDKVISLEEIVSVLLNYKKGILGFTTSLIMIAVVMVFSMQPVYEGITVLYIEPNKAKVLTIEEMYGVDNKFNDSYLNSEFETIRSRTVLGKVVQKLNLINNSEFNKEINGNKIFSISSWFDFLRSSSDDESMDDIELNNVIESLYKNIIIQPVAKSQIVKIIAFSKDKKLAAAIANEIANSYLESQMESKVNLILSATQWMKSRLDELTLNLNAAESKLQAYRDKENLVDIDGVMTVVSNEVKALTQALVDVRHKLTISENITHLINENKINKNMDLESIPAVLVHPIIRDLKAEESKIIRQLHELSKRYGNKHPKMVAAHSEIKSIRSNIRSQVSKILQGVESEYLVDKANEARLSESLEEAKRKVQDINRRQFQLLALEREVQTNKDLYGTFFKRIQEADATSDMHIPNARIIDKATVNNIPVKPKKLLIIILSAILGLFSACGLAFLVHIFNNTIRTVTEIEDQVKLPVLGVIPKQDIKLGESIAKRYFNTDFSLFSESLRTIRTGFCLKQSSKDSHLIAITSTKPGEGKTSVSTNLAFSFGQLGKTLLIDCDLRCPSVAKNLEIKERLPGLSNLISGHVDIDSCIQKFENIDVITSGLIPSNPQELLCSESFSKLIDELKKQYQYIIIDCPPVGCVSDSIIVGNLVRNVVFVIEFGVIHMKVVKNSIERLFSGDINIVGAVLNKADNSSQVDVYSQYYGGYNYIYSNSES